MRQYKVFTLQACNNPQIIITSNQIQLTRKTQLLKIPKALMKIEVHSQENEILNSKKNNKLTQILFQILLNSSHAHTSDRNLAIAIPRSLNMKEGEKGLVRDNLVNKLIPSSWNKHIYE